MVPLSLPILVLHELGGAHWLLLLQLLVHKPAAAGAGYICEIDYSRDLQLLSASDIAPTSFLVLKKEIWNKKSGDCYRIRQLIC